MGGGVAAAPSTVINGVAPPSSVGLPATQALGVSSILSVQASQSPVAAATQTVTQTLVVTVSSPPLATVTVTLTQIQAEPQATVIESDAGGGAGGVADVGNTPTFASPVPNLPALSGGHRIQAGGFPVPQGRKWA